VPVCLEMFRHVAHGHERKSKESYAFRQPASGCAGAAPGLESSAARLRFKTASGNNYAPCEAALGIGLTVTCHARAEKKRAAGDQKGHFILAKISYHQEPILSSVSLWHDREVQHSD